MVAGGKDDDAGSEGMLDDKYLRSNSIACNEDFLNQSIQMRQLFKDESMKPSEVLINTKNQKKTDNLIRMSIVQSQEM